MSEPTDDHDSSKKGNGRLKWLAVIPLIIFLVLVGLSIPDLVANMSGPESPPADCTASSAPSGLPNTSPSSTTSQPATANLEGGQTEEVDFGRSLTTRSITIYLDMSSTPNGSSYFHVHTNAFVRSDDAILRPQDISAYAERDGKTLLVNVCFKRTGYGNLSLGDPGSYVGSVTIDDSRLSTPVSVPITVTMQYPNGVFLLWLYFGAIIPGAWCIWVIRTKRDSDTKALSWDFLKWATSINGIVSIVTGSVTAFAVYMAVYLRDPTWGSSALQPLTLYGAMFSAFVTTSGLASLTGNKV